jgi:DNA-binding response OmpR family regulator
MNENILLVEDEDAMRMVLKDRLQREGYIVDSAPDGKLGLDKATSLPFDLIILDIMLPGRNGLDLCRDVRVAGLGTPILMLTALHEPEIKVAGLKAGADDYVTKPFDMLELNARVEALLRRTSTHKSLAQRDTLPGTTSLRYGGASRTMSAAGRDSLIFPSESGEGRLREALHRQVSIQKNSRLLAKVVPQLRKMLGEELQSPKTFRNKAFLDVTEGVIQFLEEIIEEIRSPKRRL